MDGPQEYEVESVTRARVHDKRGKKITWRYYVKWKGYDWDESTWEPTDSFQGGSEHILESFWDRIDTGGRDISDATAFKKGEELVVSGPPGKKLMKRKANSVKIPIPPSENVQNNSSGATISAPILSPRKRRRVQVDVGDEWESSKSKRRVSTGIPKNGVLSTRPPRRRRASSPGPRKSAPKRLPSAGDSQLDADGETDPDAIEIEDELMQASGEDAEEHTTQACYPGTTSGIPNGSKEFTFDDLEHFYSGNPIDIDQNTEDQAIVRKSEFWTQPQSPSPLADVVPESQAPTSPVTNSYDPLFDSPPYPSDKGPETQIVPHHRARAAKPLVKFIDTTTQESTSEHARITAKARLMSLHAAEVSSAGSSSGNKVKHRGKISLGHSSSGLITKNRSSLLTATSGTLKSVKGKFESKTEHGHHDEIGESSGTSEENKQFMSSGDGNIDKDQPVVPPSGEELLKLTRLKTDPESLPDYEDHLADQPLGVEEQQSLNVELTDLGPMPAEEDPVNQSSSEVKEESQLRNNIADTSPSMSGVRQPVSAPVIENSSVTTEVTPPMDETVKKNIELAKENLFPSTQPSFDSFSAIQSSFRSTIFGPLYQGSAANSPAAKDGSSTTFKVTLGDGVELPMVLEDTSEITRISNILIGSSSGGRVALFYSPEDAHAMVSAFKNDGTARVVLDPSASVIQQDRFSILLRRFQSFHTLIAPVGRDREVYVVYSSENADIAEKLGTPMHLRGLSSTLLISHASIENQLAYVSAVMKATAL